MWNEVDYWLYNMNFLIYIRSAISAVNDTVVIAAIDVLSTWFGMEYDKTEEECWDLFMHTKNGFKLFETSFHNIQNFKYQTLGLHYVPDSFEEDGNFDSLDFVLKVMRNDSVDGLLCTKIVLEIFMLL